MQAGQSLAADLAALKQTLLGAKKPGALGPEELCRILHVLAEALTPRNAFHDSALVAIDSLSIWYGRAMPLARSVPAAVVTTSLRLFEIVCENLNVGSRALTNAYSKLLAKMLKFGKATEDPVGFTMECFSRAQRLSPERKTYYVVQESLLRECTLWSSCLQDLTSQVPEICILHLENEELANAASKLFATHAAARVDPHHIEYVQLWQAEVLRALKSTGSCLPLIKYLLPRLFQKCPEKYGPWVKDTIKTRTRSPREALNLIHLAHSFDPLLSILPRDSELRKSVETSLTSWENRVEYCEALQLFCDTCSSSSGLSFDAIESILNHKHLEKLFEWNDSADIRAVAFSAISKALSRLKTFVVRVSKSGSPQDDLDKMQIIVECIRHFYAYTQKAMVPASPYSLLVLSARFMDFFYRSGFAIEVNGEPLLDLNTPALAKRILCLLTNNHSDIRALCGEMYLRLPQSLRSQIRNNQKTATTLDYLGSVKGKQSDYGADFAAVLFLEAEADGVDPAPSIKLVFERLESDAFPTGAFTAFARVLEAANKDTHAQLPKAILRRLLERTFDVWESARPILDTTAQVHTDEAQHWKSVKESSVALRQLVLYNEQHDWCCFEPSHLEQIGTLLVDQLSHSSHRGVLAEVELTFTTVSAIAMASELRLPSAWLNTCLDLLETKSQLVTRRSAGIPSLVKSILLLAIPHPSILKTFLDLVFPRLFRVANSTAVLNDKTDLPQVHAFNSMRHIFRDSTLRVAVAPFVDEALEIALENLNHQLWPIKNGAMMLFTALDETLFGTHKKNGASPTRDARVFFETYPRCAPLLERILGSDDDKSANALIPALTILSRLEMKSLDPMQESLLSLVAQNGLSHKLWKVREVAAKLLCSMLYHIESFRKSSEEMLRVDAKSLNEHHGRLMCALEMQTKGINLGHFAVQSLNEYLCLSRTNWIIARAYLLIVMRGKVDNDAESVKELYYKLFSVVQGMLQNEAINYDGQARLFLQTAIEYLFIAGSDEAELAKQFLASGVYEAQKSALKAIHRLEADYAAELSKNGVHPPDLELEILRKGDFAPGTSLPDHPKDSAVIRALKQMNAFDRAKNVTPGVFERAIDLHRSSWPRDVREKANICYSRATPNSALSARLLILLYNAVRDDSWYEERNLWDFAGAGVDVLSAIRNKAKDIADDLFFERLVTSIDTDLTNFTRDLSAPDFEVERDQFLSSAVTMCRELLLEIKMANVSSSNIAEMVVLLKRVYSLVEAHLPMLNMWGYNFHVDSAIRKVLLLDCIQNEQIRADLEKIRQLLLSFDYAI